MLPGGADGIYRRALAAGAEPYTRVEVWFDRKPVNIPRKWRGRDGGLMFLPGSVLSASLLSPVARNLNLVVPGDLYPFGVRDMLNPYGTELRVFQGVRMAGNVTRYVWPTFRGRIWHPSMSQNGADCVLVCSDRAENVIKAGFVRPQNSVPGDLVDSEFRRLITGAVPDAEFGASDTFAQRVPALAWEFDRSGAVEEMVKSAGGLWYALADGRFVARYFPWAQPGQPVITISDRRGGVILSIVNRSRPTDGLYNSITVTGERLNGDIPVYATAPDDNPDSPTFIGGPFGVVSRVVRLQTPTTQGGALATAKAILRASITLREDVSWTQVPDASVELGDIQSLDLEGGGSVVQVVKSFTLPLDPGEMQVQGVSQVIGLVEGGVSG